jgi:phage tail tape-measure protein
MTPKRLEDHYRILRHQDPLSNEAGAFPVGTGVGAALGGAAAGAAVGAVAGPVGALVGTIAGGVVGGYTGKMVSEYIDPTIDVAFARTHESKKHVGNRHAPDDDVNTATRAGEWVYNPEFSFNEQEEREQRWLPARGIPARNAIGRHMVTSQDFE